MSNVAPFGIFFFGIWEFVSDFVLMYDGVGMNLLNIFPFRRARGGEPFDHHRGKLPLLRPTSRGRASIFLTINFIGFVFANCFWLFLSRGRWVDFDPVSYWASVTTPLGMSFLRPISVLEQHGMIVVFGLLLSVLFLVPLMTAVMYRLLYAMVMAGIIFVLGHSPGLAIALAVGSFLAARTPLRSDMPFLAFLLGLLPSAVYLAVMTYEGIEPAALPFERLLVKAPVLLALVTSVAAAGVVLALVRLVGYRPGMLWPVAAVLWIVPLFLFYAFEGPALVRFHHLANSEAMAVFGAGTPFEAREETEPPDRPEESDERLRLRERDELMQRCQRLLDRHGESSVAPAVAYLYAQVASLQRDHDAYDSGVLRFRSDHVSPASRPVWERLATQYKHAPQSALARWRLAELDFAAGQTDSGLEHLTEARRKLRAVLEVPDAEKTPRSTTTSTLQWPVRETYQSALMKVDWMMWVVERHDVARDDEAAAVFARWLALDDVSMRSPEYAEALTGLIASDPDGPLADALRVALAVRLPVADRIGVLVVLAGRYESDAWAWANYEAGLLSLMHHTATTARQSTAPPTTHPTTAATEAGATLEPPVVYFRHVRAAGETPWRARAEAWLAGLESAAKPESTETD